MTKRTWLLFSLLILLGAVALGGCTTARRPEEPAPGQTRTMPEPTRVTPPTPGPGTTRVEPDPNRVPAPTPGLGTPTPEPGGTGGLPGQTGTPGTPGTTETPRPGSTVTPRPGGTTNTPRPMGTKAPGGTRNRAKAIADDIAKDKDIKRASCVVTGDTALVGLEFQKQHKGEVTDAVKKSVEKRVKKHDSSIKKVMVTADPDLLSRIKGMASDIEGGKPLSGFTTEIEEIIRRINPL